MMHLFQIFMAFFVPTAFADVWQQYYAPFGGAGTGVDFANTLAIRAGNFALKLITGAAVLAIMWGGLKMISSAGNEEGKESAKKILFYAIAGLILAIISQAAISFTHQFVSSFT